MISSTIKTLRGLLPVLGRFILRKKRIDKDVKREFKLPDFIPAQIEHELTIAAIFKNEGRYLEQWIEFHRMMGVTKFILYNNMSTDDGLETLKPYQEQGIVEIIPWPHFLRDTATNATAYAHALAYFGGKTRWMTFIDIDEYLFAPNHETVLAYLAEKRDTPILMVFWLMFGTSGREEAAEEPLIEAYTMRADPPQEPSRDQILANFKSIVQPRHVKAVRGAHRFYLEDGSIGFNEHGERMLRWKPKTVTVDQIRINHYYTKSKAEWRGRFSAGRPSQTVMRDDFLHDAFASIERAPVRDTTIQRYLPALKAALARR